VIGLPLRFHHQSTWRLPAPDHDGIDDYIGSQNQEWGPMMATALLASIPTAILIVIAQRYVSAGVTAGAVKD
jgi:ABC-type glycerol-3-phosphate transport system permease component